MPVKFSDLDLFSVEEDLFEPTCTKTFNTRRIDQTITDSAHRALEICNAQTQLMLAQYQTGQEGKTVANRQKAELIAFNLGEFDFDPETPRSNPFNEPILNESWEKGYAYGRQHKRNKSLNRLQTKFWENGIDTEDVRSQFELCALQLYRLAAASEDTADAERAKRLAMEMCRYHAGELPTQRRQQEIDRYMARQAERLASELDF